MITKIKIHGYRIYKDFTLEPNERVNLIVGGNESGKSTLLEAITLALTGRIAGRSADEDLNPYWFNTCLVDEFVRKRGAQERVAWPEIRIELFLQNRDDLQHLCGAINTEVPTRACPGITMRVLPNPDYSVELNEWAKDPSPLLPVEYYMIDWRSFADSVLRNRPRQLAAAIIDSRTVRSSTGVDYHMRQILSDQLEPAERAAISLAYRKVKASMSNETLKAVNERITEVHAALHDQPIALAMDQSARTSWEGAVTPHVSNVPFSMAGQGQQAAIKISLAMSRQSTRAAFVMIEEPENHLSHTSLTMLLSRIGSLAGDDQQLFVSTHSSYVLNRLGVGSLHLLGSGTPQTLSNLDPNTVKYFQKLPGYDTLRIVLAKKLVLVEGPSDEIIFERIFTDMYGKGPMELGIDVLSVRGLSFGRCLELCAALNKEVAAIRDNDGTDPGELRVSLQKWLAQGKRDVFIGALGTGKTLEPQLVACNGEATIRTILAIPDAADLLTWMTREKTETALRIANSKQTITPPDYMYQASRFIHG